MSNSETNNNSQTNGAEPTRQHSSVDGAFIDDASNRSVLDDVAHPFDQTNGVVEEVDRRHGVTSDNEEPIDADPDADDPNARTRDDDEIADDDPRNRGPLINTNLIAEELFDPEQDRKRPSFD
jgi:hypothetical protein